MLVPLLNEMPAGRQGVELTAKALQVTTVGERCEGGTARPVLHPSFPAHRLATRQP